MVMSATFNPTDSIEIQKKIDSIGDTPSELHFNAGDYTISSRMKFNSYTTVTCDPDAVFTLIKNAPVSIFGEQIPIFGQKKNTITGLDISGITYRGNYDSQSWTHSDHGLGFGNCFGFTSLTNSYFHDMDLGYNEGDEFRLSYCSGLEFANITSAYGGHDAFHLKKCSDTKIHNCNIDLRASNAVRVRGSSRIYIYDNEFDGSSNLCWGPAVQIENFEKGFVIDTVEVTNNNIHDTFGAAVWGIAKSTAGVAKNILIKGNKMTSCGKMPKINKLSGVGGTVFDGFRNVTIDSNEIKDCQGYGIMFGSYIGSSTLSGLNATVTNNTISGTRKSNYIGKMSGTAIANLTGARTKVSCQANIVSNNLASYYAVTTLK